VLTTARRFIVMFVRCVITVREKFIALSRISRFAVMSARSRSSVPIMFPINCSVASLTSVVFRETNSSNTRRAGSTRFLNARSLPETFANFVSVASSADIRRARRVSSTSSSRCPCTSRNCSICLSQNS